MAPKIAVRTVNELREEIFGSGTFRQYERSLHTAEEMKCQDLYQTYPPSFRDKNKQFIYKFINQVQHYSPAPERFLLISRWKPFLPETIPANVSTQTTKVEFRPDVFGYEPPVDRQSVEWYLNFANHDLFAYYSGPLLAQDELQVLECVELAALREYFVQTVNTVGPYTTGADVKTKRTIPTPILISNTERVIEMDTNKVYGNAFAKASERQLIQACRYLPRPQTVNLVAIEAPSHGRGSYTREQVEYILFSCYVGFKAAQILASKTHALNAGSRGSSNTRIHTVIHTGWWGCGAYGNNRQMMIMTQLLAAYWTELDQIIFHVQNKDYDKDIQAARESAEKLLKEKHVDSVIDQIVRMNLQWEKSNDT